MAGAGERAFQHSCSGRWERCNPCKIALLPCTWIGLATVPIVPSRGTVQELCVGAYCTNKVCAMHVSAAYNRACEQTTHVLRR